MWAAGQRLIGYQQVCFLSGVSLMSARGNRTTDLCSNTAAGRRASISHHAPLVPPAGAHAAFKASGRACKSQFPLTKIALGLLFKL